MLTSKISPFHPKLGINECHFGLPLLWAVIQLILSMCILLNQKYALNNAHWQSWIEYCSQLWQTEMTFVHAWFKLKRDNLGSWYCLTKCALENKLPHQNWWSWYHFSQEKLPHTLISVIASTYCGKYAIPFFFWATLYSSRALVMWREMCISCSRIHNFFPFSS